MNNFKVKSFVSVTAVIICFSLVMPRPVAAFNWGGIANYVSQFLKTSLEKIAKEIEVAIVLEFKKEFLNSITAEINGMIAGDTSGESLIISDWNDFIEVTARKKADIYVNDLITLSTRGASIDYSGRIGSHKAMIELVMKGSAKNIDLAIALRPDYDEYVSTGKLEDMFMDGSWAPFVASFQPNNYAPAVAMTVQGIKQQKYEEAKEQQKTEAMSSGFKAVKDDSGKTTSPVGIVSGLGIEANLSSLKATVNSDSVAQVLVSLATQMAKKTLTSGLYTAARSSIPDASVLMTGGGFPGMPGGSDTYSMTGEFSGLNSTPGVGNINTSFSPFGNAPGF